MFGKGLKGALLLAATILPTAVFGAATTDEYRDADEGQSSYLPNHNMDPTIVGSSGFGILWQKPYGADRFFAKPLTFTSAKGLNGNKQVVIMVSNLNSIYIEDAKSALTVGTIAKRTLYAPFTQVDQGGCPDLGGPAGIIGTPVIDPVAEVMYLFAKGYKNGGTGLANGAYRFHAIDLNDKNLNDIAGYPIMIDGSVADNDKSIYFNGGPAMNRPALMLKNGVVYGGFGSHCDKANFTGSVIGVNIASASVVAYFSTEISPWLPTGRLDMTASSGQGGIWMGGTGLASDGNRIFFATGNGKGKQNTMGVALSGKYPLATLSESVINLQIGAGGALSLQDWFQPANYAQMDNYDEDLGSAGVTLLDPTVFNGAGVSRMALAYGKNNFMYVLNADNLGGFGLGAGGGDNIIQSINAQATTFGGSGSYAGEGGYIYFVPSGYPLQCYKLGHDANGKPTFSYAGQSSMVIQGRIGPPTVTSMNGKAGSAIVWVADNNNGLLAFNAVPPSSGILTQITLPPTGGLNKFQRAAFGDGRVYTSNSNGVLYCLGSPVNLALNCTSPLDLGQVPFGQTASGKVTCTALTAVKINYISIADTGFTSSNSSLPTTQLAANQQFSFSVTYTAPSDSDPGVITSSITISVTPNTNAFANSVPVGLSANVVSSSPYIVIQPPNVYLAPIIIGDPDAGLGEAGNFVIGNTGQMPLTISRYAYSIDGGNTLIDITKNVTNSDYWNVGDGFNILASTLPAVGSTIQPGVQETVDIQFFAINGGAVYDTALFVYSNANKVARLTLGGTASSAPRAVLRVANGEGGWNDATSYDFGPLLAKPGNTAVTTLQVCNTGGSDLITTKSKPVSNQWLSTDVSITFPEGQVTKAGQCSYGNITFTAGTALVNMASQSITGDFILNFNDAGFNGPLDFKFTGTVVPVQVGPQIASGARYQYAGCYHDSKCGTTGALRCLTKQVSGSNTNVESCLNMCLAAGYPVAATEYHTECWCGTTIPTAQFIDNTVGTSCTYTCPGDTTGGLERCGGDLTVMNLFYDTMKFPNGPSSSAVSSTPIASTKTTTSLTSTTSKPVVTTTTSSTSTSTTSSTSTSTTSSTSASTTSSTSTSTTTPVTSTTSPSSNVPITTGTTTSSVSSTSTTPSVPASTTSASVTSTPTTFMTTTKPTLATATNSVTMGYASMGCFSEPAGVRQWTRILANKSMNVELCIQVAQAHKPPYNFIGLEYGQECWAATTTFVHTSVTVTQGGCTKPCSGNTLESCGAANKFNYYVATSATAVPSP